MFIFASKQQGQRIIAQWDEYLVRLSRIERRLKTESKDTVTKAGFLEHLRSCVLDWDDEDRNMIAPVLKEVLDVLASKSITNNNEITLIKTDGRDEWNSAYTRGSTIYLPPKKLRYEKKKLLRLLLHEIFHVIFRQKKDIQRALYNLIGFDLINEVELPESLKERKLTNPDGPMINSHFEFEYGDATISAAPIILLKEDCTIVNSTKDILNSISIKMMVVEEKDGRWQAKLEDNKALLIEPKSIAELIERVGKNFAASPDPNEILAEAFVKMVLDEQDSYIDLAKFRIIMQKVS